MYLDHIDYYAPQTAPETLELLGRLGNQARVLAGGTDLLLLMKRKLINPRSVIDINAVDEFRGLDYEAGKGMVIGAATRIAEVEASAAVKEHYYALHQAAKELGSAQVRAMATIGGNICNASPAAETATPLVALETRITICSTAGEREIKLEDFILGNRETALKEGELVTRFILPDPVPRSASRYINIGLRNAMEIDPVNMTANLVLEDDGRTVKALRFVMGSVAPKPIISAAVPDILVGQAFGDDLVEKAAAAAAGEARPISDIRASADYRREVVPVLAKRVLQQAFKAAQEV